MKKVFLVSVIFVFVIMIVSSGGALAEKKIVLAAGIDDSSSKALLEFKKEMNIDVKVEPISQRRTTIVDLLLNQDSSFDVYRLYSNNNTLKSIASKGYYINLNEVGEICIYTDQLIPQVADVIAMEDSIIAIPTSIEFPYVFYLNSELLKECGVSKEKLPKTLFELFDFIDGWYENKSDEYDNITPFFAHGFPYSQYNPYLGMVLEIYRDNIIADTGRLNYNTEIFRRLIQRIEKYNKDMLKYEDSMEDEPQRQECLIYCAKANTSTIFMYANQTFIQPFSLAAGMQSYQPFYLECAFINPYSSQVDACKKLLTYYALFPNEKLKCAISLQAAPVEKASFSTDYNNWIKIKDNAINKLQSNKISIEEKEEYESQIEWVNSLLNNIEQYQYEVSPMALKSYQDILVPILFARGNSIYDLDSLNRQIDSKINRYIDRSISLDTMIRELDNTIDLLIREEGINTP